MSGRLREGLGRGPVGVALAVFAALLSVSAVVGIPFSSSLPVMLLIAFMVGARLGLARATVRDLSGMRPRLDCSDEEFAGIVHELETRGGLPEALGSCVAAVIGLFVIPDSNTGTPYLLSETPWSRGYVWALALNALLFALMGRLAVQTFQQVRVLERLEGRLGEIDLLDPEALVLFARRGLRSAGLWMVGSAIASLIFVNTSFHWATGAVITATLTIGTLAFVLPMRGVHRRLRQARRDELARVRGAIGEERRTLLDARSASAHLTNLLAYEARVERVKEWPFDLPTLLRFLGLAVLAAGSWLGGALVERLLGALLG